MMISNVNECGIQYPDSYGGVSNVSVWYHNRVSELVNNSTPSNIFPLFLPGGWSMIGIVQAKTAKAMNVFKYMVASGVAGAEFVLKDAMADSDVVARVANLSTIEDFTGKYAFDQNDGYIDIISYISALRENYLAALENNSDEDKNEVLKGHLAFCVSGVYSVRPVWKKIQGTDNSPVSQEETATQYYLERLDFGTEAQLATWNADEERYDCDYEFDEEGTATMREDPIVKSVYTSMCPNADREVEE